jgi:hypothetical protein
VLMVIIVIGILFDMLGIAAAVADEVPFHAMAANRIPGAQQSISIIKNAGTVSSFAGDFVGDVCGTIAGALAIAVAAGTRNGQFGNLTESLLVASVAALTVGGKAMGKHFALSFSKEIVLKAGRTLYWVEKNLHITLLRRPKRKAK